MLHLGPLHTQAKGHDYGIGIMYVTIHSIFFVRNRSIFTKEEYTNERFTNGDSTKTSTQDRSSVQINHDQEITSNLYDKKKIYIKPSMIFYLDKDNNVIDKNF